MLYKHRNSFQTLFTKNELEELDFKRQKYMKIDKIQDKIEFLRDTWRNNELGNVKNLGTCDEKGTEYFKFKSERLMNCAMIKTFNNLHLSRKWLCTSETNSSSPDYEFDMFHIWKQSALKGLVNCFHTSPVHKGTIAQRVVGVAIDNLIKNHRISRKELHVSWEIGQVSDDLWERMPAILSILDLWKKGEIKESDFLHRRKYWLHNEFLEFQIDQARNNMNLKTLDIAYIHLPIDNLSTYNYSEMSKVMLRVFQFWETMILWNKINGYGFSINIDNIPPPSDSDNAIEDYQYKRVTLDNILRMTNSLIVNKPSLKSVIIQINHNMLEKSGMFSQILSFIYM